MNGKHVILSAIGGRKSTKTILMHVNFTFSWIHGCKTRESKMQILTIGRSICSFSFRIIRSMSYYDRLVNRLIRTFDITINNNNKE